MKIWLRTSNENLANGAFSDLCQCNTSQGIRYLHIYDSMKVLGLDVTRQDPGEPCIELVHGWGEPVARNEGNISIYATLGTELISAPDRFLDYDILFVASEYYRKLVSITEKPVRVWCCAGVDSQIFHTFVRSVEPFVFLHSVYPRFHKGSDLVCEAFENKFLNTDGVELHIHYPIRGGEGYILEYFKYRYESEKIKFIEHKYMPRREAWRLYEGHCYVYPSLWDSWVNTPNEASSTGIPSILSDLELFRYLQPSEGVWFLPMYFNRKHFKEGSPSFADLATAMDYCYNNQDEVAARGKVAAAFVRDHYDWKNLIMTQLVPTLEEFGFLERSVNE